MNVIDFFCGAGGASCGLQHSENARVVAAVNHDPQAIACHAENHPEARHYSADIKRLNPELLARRSASSRGGRFPYGRSSRPNRPPKPSSP